MQDAFRRKSFVRIEPKFVELEFIGRGWVVGGVVVVLMCERSVKRVRGVVCVEVWLLSVNADDTTTTSPTYKSVNCVYTRPTSR
jgi:hypothetical protein